MSADPALPDAPAVTVGRLAADPLVITGDPETIVMREDLGHRLAAVAPGGAARVSRLAGGQQAARLAIGIDLIVQRADKAISGGQAEGHAALAALANVTAILALQHAGVDFAGRHYRGPGQCRPAKPATGDAGRGTPLNGIRRAHLRKETGPYFTPPALVDCLLESTLGPLGGEAPRANDPEARLPEIAVCDPACGARTFLARAARMLAWYLAMHRAGASGRIQDQLPAVRRHVTAQLIRGVDISPLTVDPSHLVTAATGYIPGLPNLYLAHHLKCGNAPLGVTHAVLAKGIPAAAYKPLDGDVPVLTAETRRRNRAEHEALLNGLPAAAASASGPLLAAIARAAARTLSEAHRARESTSEVRLAKRVADAWCAAFVWPHVPGGPPAVTTGTLLHLAGGGTLASCAERMLADLTRQYQFFHWRLEHPGVFRPAARAEAA